ncbi:MAG TPA: methylated-DNA--[protein]-cysteine S-methyltransferase [Candidatus Binatia bacterium]|jgi:methylated-DNA-[protein]-cysteine S-methyltransferase|nr:methylated-DNA--[protein]-cysteine S-methyltransferase [Candidatus Binatia bacterium]
MTIETGEVETPIGTLAVAVRDGRLCALEFDGAGARLAARLARRFGRVAVRVAPDPGGVIGRLRAYMEGDLDALASVVVDTAGTPFQEAVWRAMRAIPAGETVSYGALARRLGAPAAVRAVGAASGANPVPVVVPCHRIVGADGGLTGFGGGLARKRWLLAHEGARVVTPADEQPTRHRARRRGAAVPPEA